MVRMLVALGGNALARADEKADWDTACRHMHSTANALAPLVKKGHELLLTHGNGPQVGQLLVQNELAAREVPSRPLYVLDAETEGQIGFLIAQELTNALTTVRAPRSVLSLIGRVVVSPRDPAFRRPTKPVGRFYSDSEARILKKSHGWTLVFDGARGGWRRVVPSPRPRSWVEADAFRVLIRNKLLHSVVPVLMGGGGVPVIRRASGKLEGVEAVVDKDLTAALVARETQCHTLAIVTDVPAVAVGFHRPWERWLGAVRSSELESYYAKREFGEGSMAPKVEAALDFLKGGGAVAVITDIPSLGRAIRGEAGTRITPG